MTYSIDFACLECEKNDNVTRAMEMCQNIIKDPKNTPWVIVTDRYQTDEVDCEGIFNII